MNEMMPAYRSGMSQEGSCLLDAKIGQEVIQGVIESETLFPNISRAVSKAAAAVSQEAFRALTILFTKVWCHIMSDIHYVLAKNEMDIKNEARMKLEEKQYLAQVQGKLQRLEEKHRFILESIEKF
jgi:hypothetical protein